MTWNYRVVQTLDGSLGIHEVYYDKHGKINGWSEGPISICVDEEEGIDAIKWDLKHMKLALKKPVLREIREKIGKIVLRKMKKK